jgi:hypothetical protein
MNNQCRATSKRTGKRCRRLVPFGYATCHYHGGAPRSGGQPWNTNAVSHGVYQRVDPDRLSPEERAVFDQMPTDLDLSVELRALRLMLLKTFGSLEYQEVIGTPIGAEVVERAVDEVAKAYAAAKLADGVRKLVKEVGGGDRERFKQLLSALGTTPRG